MLLSITIAKTGLTYERTVEELPAETVAYLLRNGYSQRLRDCHASIQRKDFKTEDEFKTAVAAACDHVMNQLDTGMVPGTRTEPSSDAARIRAAAKKAGMSVDEVLALIESAVPEAA